jgi:hypothetical protein
LGFAFSVSFGRLFEHGFGGGDGRLEGWMTA